MAHCIRHYEEPVVAHCRTCGNPFCGRCLVFSFGPRKPPYCVGCALSASGVRNTKRVVTAAAPADDGERISRREQRARQKAAKRAAKAGAPDFGPPPPPPGRSDNVPAAQVLGPPASRYASGAGPQQVS